MGGGTRSQKQKRELLVRSLRFSGSSWVDVAEALRRSHRLNARVAFRYAHGWSQARAADEWNKHWPDETKTFKNFSHWESWPGPTGHAPTYDNLSKLAELYECSVSDLLADLPNFRHLDAAGSPKPVASEKQSALRDECILDSDTARSIQDNDRNTQNFPTSSQPVASSAPAPTRGHRRGDPDADMAVMQSFRAADTKVGGAHLYATVVNYLRTQLAPRLFDVGHDIDNRQVFASAAALTEMVGWMAHDAGNDTVASRHFSRSLDFATVGGDRYLAAHICGSMSHLAHHQRRPHHAIHLAQQGIQALHGGPPQPSLHARLLTLHAKAEAALGRVEECTRLLVDAERKLGGSDSSYAHSPWVNLFDEGSFAHEVARCMHQLGHLGEAQRQARHVLALRADDRTRSRAFAQLILIATLIDHGDIDQACTLGQKVLDATQSLGSHVVLQQLVNLKKLLRPHQKNATVTKFLACLGYTLHERLCLYQWPASNGHEYHTGSPENT